MSNQENAPIVDKVEALRRSAAEAAARANLRLDLVSPTKHEMIAAIQRAAGEAAIEANLRTPSLQPVAEL